LEGEFDIGLPHEVGTLMQRPTATIVRQRAKHKKHFEAGQTNKAEKNTRTKRSGVASHRRMKTNTFIGHRDMGRETIHKLCRPTSARKTYQDVANGGNTRSARTLMMPEFFRKRQA